MIPEWQKWTVVICLVLITLWVYGSMIVNLTLWRVEIVRAVNQATANANAALQATQPRSGQPATRPGQ